MWHLVLSYDLEEQDQKQEQEQPSSAPAELERIAIIGKKIHACVQFAWLSIWNYWIRDAQSAVRSTANAQIAKKQIRREE